MDGFTFLRDLWRTRSFPVSRETVTPTPFPRAPGEFRVSRALWEYKQLLREMDQPNTIINKLGGM